ncbi:DUF2157 domain-containing protein [Niveispirillum sp. KHB5.9]|uniref:DUF2157 domain-containing protein n=1 Tax=Niveispirillum sp. KHB5.9 TaxID=3400269 RepID=UPI003A8BC4B4
MGPVFGLQGKLADWRREGFIDADQAERIAAFEAGRGRPKLALALAVLGAFTIGVGIIAIIAANWDEIPISLRLGLHVAVNLGLGGTIWYWARQHSPDLEARVEGGVLLLSLSTLGLIAHIGQSFQLQGTTAGLLGGWLLLATPFTWALARGGLNRWVWTLGLFGWLLATLDEHHHWLNRHHLMTSCVALSAAAFYALRAACPPLPPAWARYCGQVSVGAVIAGLTIMLLIVQPLHGHAASAETQIDALIGAGIGLLALVAAHLLVPSDRRGSLRIGLGLALALAPPLSILPLLLSGVTGAIITGVAFCLYWIGLARLALMAHQTNWFRLAVALIAVRVFVAYLDAAGGLMATGLGLVLAGLVLIALAFGASRVMSWGKGRGA